MKSLIQKIIFNEIYYSYSLYKIHASIIFSIYFLHFVSFIITEYHYYYNCNYHNLKFPYDDKR